MPKPLSSDLRQCVINDIIAGHSARASARRLGVSESFAIKLVKRWRQEGHIEPRHSGRPVDRGKPRHYKNTLHKVLKQEPDITLSELCVQLSERHGVNIHPGNPGRYPGFSGYTYKKTLVATERGCADVKHKHDIRHNKQKLMKLEPHRLVFIDEMSTKTNMSRICGRSVKGTRLEADAPYGHCKTQSFIAGLRHDGITAPRVLDGSMNRASFDVYVEKELAPTLKQGDIVIPENLPAHKSEHAKKALRERGAWFLPPYSPGLNPVGMAFPKLKAYLRKAKAGTIEDLWKAIGNICDLYTPKEYRNTLNAAGYCL